jgi:hypothetical protein
LSQFAEFPAGGGNGDGLRRIEKLKCPGETKQAMVERRMLRLIGRRNRTAVGGVQAKLGYGKVVDGGSVGKLGTNRRQQKRLHHQRIDCRRANQPSPEVPKS